MRLFSVVLLAVALTVPGAALGKAPAKRDVDQQLLSLPSAQLTSVREAEDRLHDFEQSTLAIETELANAKLEQDAAKAWVDASRAVSTALEASKKAAEAAARTDELEDLGARIARAKQTTEWREARWQASREAVTLQQARLSLVKSEVNRAREQVELARLTVYNESKGSDPDIEVEIGKSQAKVGRLGTQVGRDRKKAEEAERKYDDAVAAAGNLDPSM